MGRRRPPTPGMLMTDTTQQDFRVADLSLAEFGRKEIRLAEHEMPGLVSLRARYADEQPLAGARIVGSLHMTIQTAVLIETLTALGADVRWVSCNIFSTQDHAAAAIAVGPEGTVENPGTPGVCMEGRDPRRILVGDLSSSSTGPTARVPNLIPRRRWRRHDARSTRASSSNLLAAVPATPDDASEEEGVFMERLAQHVRRRLWLLAAHCSWHPRRKRRNHHRCAPPGAMAAEGSLLFPQSTVNDSVTKSKFDNLYGIRHSLIDGINRGTDVMLGGKLRSSVATEGLRGSAGRSGRSRHV
ncbi:Adenosylhomocysteinase [Nymphon striatum]|nr:Adenosylhomocysteinase [Nymphon striatum]